MTLPASSPQRTVSLDQVRFFLHLGYFPSYREEILPVDFSAKPSTPIPIDESDLIAEAHRTWMEGIQEQYRANADIVVPISGGFDSRVILASLLKFREASRIQTMTYGTPGTLDYELGREVARSVGAPHTAMSLTGSPSTLPELIDTAKAFRLQTILFHHPRLTDFYQTFGASEIWSGFIGDLITGSCVKTPGSTSLEAAKLRYCAHRKMYKSLSLCGMTTEELAAQIDVEPLAGSSMTFDEQLIALEAAPAFVAPHLIYPGIRYVTPFINNEFMRFSFATPHEQRVGQRLFRSMVQKHYPELFMMRTTRNYGGRMNEPAWRTRMRHNSIRARNLVRRKLPFTDLRTEAMTKYLDFDKASRPGGIYHEVFRDCIQGLAKRELLPWIDVRGIWQDHLSRKVSAGRELAVLASLEILLRAGLTVTDAPNPQSP